MRVATYRFIWVDAFTSKPFTGNPCAVVTDADGLDDAAMQTIALELHLSETAFVFDSKEADYAVRFFTPRKEIPLAGHPSIATARALLDLGRIRGPRFTQELIVGVLPIEVENDLMWMTQKAPSWGAVADSKLVASALGISDTDLLPGLPMQVVSTGTPQLMVPLQSVDVLDRLRPDPTKLAAVEAELGAFATHPFALGDGAIESRHFGPVSGTGEDPFTGSAAGAMGAYLVHHGLTSDARIKVVQGRHVARPGVGWVEVSTSRVRVGGAAVAVAHGEITWP